MAMVNVLRGLERIEMGRTGFFLSVFLVASCNAAGASSEGRETEAAASQASPDAPSDTAAAARDGLSAFEADEILPEIDALELSDLGYAESPPTLSAQAERWHGVGLQALREREADRAVSAFAIVLDQTPDSAEASLNLARALALRGEHQRAARAVAHALVREFPHAWRDYAEAQDLASLRRASQHARLTALRDRLETLHTIARETGVAHTVTWTPSGERRGAQAGLRVAGRFVPVAPRVWSTTAVPGGTPWVDAVFDAQAGVVLQVVARGGAARRHTALRLLSARDGDTLGLRDFGTDAEVLDVRLVDGQVDVRLPDAAWTDLKGRAVRRDVDPLQGSRIRLDSTGLRRL